MLFLPDWTGELERIAPAPKDKLVSFPLPEMKDAMDASQAASSVLTAVSDGELTPIEVTRVMGLIDSYRRTLELTEIEGRLQALEEIWESHFWILLQIMLSKTCGGCF